MIIKKDDDVSEGIVEEEGIKNVIRKILIKITSLKILFKSLLNFYVSSLILKR